MNIAFRFISRPWKKNVLFNKLYPQKSFLSARGKPERFWILPNWNFVENLSAICWKFFYLLLTNLLHLLKNFPVLHFVENFSLFLENFSTFADIFLSICWNCLYFNICFVVSFNIIDNSSPNPEFFLLFPSFFLISEFFHTSEPLCTPCTPCKVQHVLHTNSNSFKIWYNKNTNN